MSDVPGRLRVALLGGFESPPSVWCVPLPPPRPLAEQLLRLLLLRGGVEPHPGPVDLEQVASSLLALTELLGGIAPSLLASLRSNNTPAPAKTFASVAAGAHPRRTPPAPSAHAALPPSEVCRDFLRGACTRHKCRFVHPRPRAPAAAHTAAATAKRPRTPAANTARTPAPAPNTAAAAAPAPRPSAVATAETGEELPAPPTPPPVFGVPPPRPVEISQLLALAAKLDAHFASMEGVFREAARTRASVASAWSSAAGRFACPRSCDVAACPFVGADPAALDAHRGARHPELVASERGCPPLLPPLPGGSCAVTAAAAVLEGLVPLAPSQASARELAAAAGVQGGVPASPVVVAAALAASLPQAPCTLVETWADCAHCSAPEEQRMTSHPLCFVAAGADLRAVRTTRAEHAACPLCGKSRLHMESWLFPEEVVIVAARGFAVVPPTAMWGRQRLTLHGVVTVEEGHAVAIRAGRRIQRLDFSAAGRPTAKIVRWADIPPTVVTLAVYYLGEEAAHEAVAPAAPVYLRGYTDALAASMPLALGRPRRFCACGGPAEADSEECFLCSCRPRPRTTTSANNNNNAAAAVHEAPRLPPAREPRSLSRDARRALAAADMAEALGHPRPPVTASGSLAPRDEEDAVSFAAGLAALPLTPLPAAPSSTAAAERWDPHHPLGPRLVPDDDDNNNNNNLPPVAEADCWSLAPAIAGLRSRSHPLLPALLDAVGHAAWHRAVVAWPVGRVTMSRTEFAADADLAPLLLDGPAPVALPRTPFPGARLRKTGDEVVLPAEPGVVLTVRGHTTHSHIVEKGGDGTTFSVPTVALSWVRAPLRPHGAASRLHRGAPRAPDLAPLGPPAPAPDGPAPAGGAPPAATAGPVIPDMSPEVLREALALRRPLIGSIPVACRVPLAGTLASALRGTMEGRWSRFLAFAQLVLAHPGSGAKLSEVLLRRARLLARGDYGALLAELRGARPAPPVPTSELESSADDVDGHSFPWPAEPVPPAAKATLLRCAQLVRSGDTGKASRALQATRIASGPEAEAALRVLHPVADALPIPAVEGDPLTCDVTAVKRCLKSFAPCSSGGPSGLTPRILRQLCSAVGDELARALVPLADSILSGTVPAALHEHVFGARLIALAKKGGGVRPIAVGETIRRLAGKILAWHEKNAVGAALRARGQYGVATPLAAEALVHVLRHWRSTHAPGQMLLKVDLANAFNCVSRSAIIAAAAALSPRWGHYAAAAYSRASPLRWTANISIPSTQGVQQGDPCGPALFALALAEFLATAPPVSHAAWYLDDGYVIGSAAELDAWLRHVRFAGPPLGFHLNVQKCELFADPDLAELDFAEDSPLRLVPRPAPSALTVLGVAVTAEGQSLQWDDLTTRLRAQTQAFSAVAATHPLAALRLLVECGGTAALTYFLRCIPPPADISKLTALDEILDESVELIVGAVSPAALTQARAPTRFGGIGLRRITPLSPIAHFASLAQCIQSLPLCAHLPRDLCLFPLIAHPSLFPFPQVTSLMSSVLGDGPYPKKIQKSLSLALDTAAFVLLHSSLPADEKARLISLTQHGSSLWLHLPKAALEDNVWMSPSTAHTALRLRLGLPLGSNHVCTLCRHQNADGLGRHALSCMRGGQKPIAHNRVRDALHGLCTYALLAVRREAHPWGDGQRMDLTIQNGAKEYLIDIALILPTLEQHRAHATHSSAKPGGAATEYELVKTKEYGAKVTASQQLVPMIFEVFGGLGDSAKPMLGRIAKAYSIRFGSRAGSAVFYSRLNVAVTEAVAFLARTSGA